MKEKEYDLRGFKFEDVMDECSKYSSLEEQIDYLIYVEKKWISERPLLDPNGPGRPNFEERIRAEIELRENKYKLKEDRTKLPDGIVKIKGKTGLIDITRIFLAMDKSNIISHKTEASQIARIFFSEPLERDKFARKFTASKIDLEKHDYNSNSNELLEFTKILIEQSFNKKEKQLRELDKHINKLLENLI
jgi:hypothetical protein